MSNKDLTGEKYGRLLVLKATDERYQGCIIYRCLCDCGNIILVRSTFLRNGHTKSCGCLCRDHTYEKNMVDIAGKRFHRLFVISETKRRSAGSIVWKCLCDCGNTTFVSAGNLKNGHTKSCGCLREDTSKASKTLFPAGKESPNWKGGITPENERLRRSTAYKNWRASVLSRDNSTCLICGERKNLVVHHLEGFADNIDLRFDVNNGVTLCHKCHNLFHNQFGRGQNTRRQFEIFLWRIYNLRYS